MSHSRLTQCCDDVLATGLTPTHLDWHALADGGRNDIFDLSLALAEEYQLAARVAGPWPTGGAGA